MNRGSRGRCWVVNSPPTCISSPGVWEPQSDCSLHAARDKRRGGKGMRENRTYTIITCWRKHTIHFLNQVALISSKARRWAGSRAFSVPGEVCCWGNDSRENVLSITSSMYLKQSEEKSQRGVIRSTLFAAYFSRIKCILTRERWRSKLTSQGDGSKMSSPPFGSRSSIGSEVSQGQRDKTVFKHACAMNNLQIEVPFNCCKI